MTAKEHYDTHLANIYSWMAGDFEGKQREQEEFFRINGIAILSSKTAIDLGAGHGLQTLSLLNLGFDVISVDFNDHLLHELKVNTNGRANMVEDELISFLTNYRGNADVISCMGDTITHLTSVEQVGLLLRESRRILVESGQLVISFRDLTKELVGEQRFIPVKSDESRIATCFLEYFSTHVMVHDILHEKINEVWMQRISSYAKLRLNLSALSNLLIENHFAVIHSEVTNRMVYVIAKKVN